MLTNCVVSKPPSIDPLVMVKKYNEQVIEQGKCNNKFKKLREWKAKQMEINK